MNSPMVTKIERETYTPIELKHLNLQSVYNYLYDHKTASRLAIANNTGLSLPTVAANIQELVGSGLVLNCGEQKSTGGRRAQEFACNNLARIAIGVEILKESIQIGAIDLYGTILRESSKELVFANEDAYYQELGNFVNAFANMLPFEKKQLLGIGIAIQGLISHDGETIEYSGILKCPGVRRDKFQQYIDLPCVLMHDTGAAALAEIWHTTDIRNAIYLALNRNFGGTLILNGHVQKSKELSSGTIEHMCLDPTGPLCYCGQHGCIETFCSANLLREKSGLEIPVFFERLHENDQVCKDIWDTFTRYLSIAINNIRMVVDCDFIIGGYLMQFMNEDDLILIQEYVKQHCFNNNNSFLLKPSRYGDKSPMLGAAIALVDSFLLSI